VLRTLCNRLPMPRPIEALIHVDAVRQNLATLAARAPGRRLWAVVKANAYGHGLERVLRGLDAADGLALLDLAEAERARAAGWRKPILLLEGCFAARDLEVVERLGLTTTVHEPGQLQWLAAARPAQPLPVYLKLNTGMNRLGFAGAAAPAALAQLRVLPQVELAAVAMHFANADAAPGTAQAGSVAVQLAAFERLAGNWRGARSLCNSAALLTQPQLVDDWARPGIALYGSSPVAGVPASRFGLRAAMTLRSRLIAVQDVAAGAAVGYGSRWVAARAARIGIVACGYADGYPRVAPDGTPLAVNGTIVPLAGRVSMDMITVDLTGVPQAQVGDPVELWGDQVTIDAVAEAAGTVGYELMCALAPRVPVRLVDRGADAIAPAPPAAGRC
jgi:alanine racemase